MAGRCFDDRGRIGREFVSLNPNLSPDVLWGTALAFIAMAVYGAATAFSLWIADWGPQRVTTR